MTTIPLTQDLLCVLSAIALLLAFLLGRASRKPKTICPTLQEQARSQFLRRHAQIANSLTMPPEEKYEKLMALEAAFFAVFGEEALK